MRISNYILPKVFKCLLQSGVIFLFISNVNFVDSYEGLAFYHICFLIYFTVGRSISLVPQ